MLRIHRRISFSVTIITILLLVSASVVIGSQQLKRTTGKRSKHASGEAARHADRGEARPMYRPNRKADMRYIKVKWVHNIPTEPIWLYCELSDGSWETRKVEIFPDGSAGFASSSESAGTTRLAVEPIPSLEVIASDAQFVPVEISRQEFEDVWARRFDPERL